MNDYKSNESKSKVHVPGLGDGEFDVDGYLVSVRAKEKKVKRDGSN